MIACMDKVGTISYLEEISTTLFLVDMAMINCLADMEPTGWLGRPETIGLMAVEVTTL